MSRIRLNLGGLATTWRSLCPSVKPPLTPPDGGPSDGHHRKQAPKIGDSGQALHGRCAVMQACGWNVCGSGAKVDIATSSRDVSATRTDPSAASYVPPQSSLVLYYIIHNIAPALFSRGPWSEAHCFKLLSRPRAYGCNKLPSIEDRGQAYRVTILANCHFWLGTVLELPLSRDKFLVGRIAWIT